MYYRGISRIQWVRSFIQGLIEPMYYWQVGVNVFKFHFKGGMLALNLNVFTDKVYIVLINFHPRMNLLYQIFILG